MYLGGYVAWSKFKTKDCVSSGRRAVKEGPSSLVCLQEKGKNDRVQTVRLKIGTRLE